LASSQGSIELHLRHDRGEALILADLGMPTTEKILQEVNRRVKQKTIEAGAGLQAGVIETVRDILLAATPAAVTALTAPPRPWVLLMVGVNGVGKTTTLGKLAYQFQAAGEKSLLVAADTFRAAAIEQAELWAKRAGVDIIKGQPGGDAAAVAFDAVRAARARQVERVLEPGRPRQVVVAPPLPRQEGQGGSETDGCTQAQTLLVGNR
jgi:fused signal recognition particle receptor